MDLVSKHFSLVIKCIYGYIICKHLKKYLNRCASSFLWSLSLFLWNGSVILSNSLQVLLKIKISLHELYNALGLVSCCSPHLVANTISQNSHCWCYSAYFSIAHYIWKAIILQIKVKRVIFQYEHIHTHSGQLDFIQG